MDQLNIFSGTQQGGPKTEEFFQILEEHRKLCEREGRFQEAEQTRKRLKGKFSGAYFLLKLFSSLKEGGVIQLYSLELRKHQDQRQKDHLTHKMRAQLLALQNAHKSQLREFNNKWDNVIQPDFANQTELLYMELRRKHHEELQQFKQSLQKDQALKYHVSSQIIGLRKKLEILGQMVSKPRLNYLQGKYIQAKDLKKKVKGIEKTHHSKFMDHKKEKIDTKSHHLIAKHEKEISALKNRLHSLFNRQEQNLIMQRNKQLDIIVKRFNNVKKDIQKKYKMNKIQQEKTSPVRRMIVREQIHKK